MENILELIDLTKNYKSFKLDKVSFNLQSGCIMGLIGKNGAGKTTIINTILDIVKKDSGIIRMFGKECLGKQEYELVGAVFDDNSLPEYLSVKEVNIIFGNIYSNWDEKKYYDYISRLEVPQNTKVKEMSKGNKIKLNLVVALSHSPKLLILDEITGALDPVMRNEILQMFLEFVQDESKSILFSSHITTDLEKIADFIVFVNNGKLVFHKEKDDLAYNYNIVKCRKQRFEGLDKFGVLAYLEENGVVKFIIEHEATKKLPINDILIEETSLEDIMLILVKGEVL